MSAEEKAIDRKTLPWATVKEIETVVRKNILSLSATYRLSPETTIEALELSILNLRAVRAQWDAEDTVAKAAGKQSEKKE